MPRKPWNSRDRLRSHRLTVTAAVLSTIALAARPSAGELAVAKGESARDGIDKVEEIVRQRR